MSDGNESPSSAASKIAAELDSPAENKPGADGLGEGEDWALAELAARIARTERKQTHRVSDIQRGEVMSEPQ
jgi:hypothetical protein